MTKAEYLILTNPHMSNIVGVLTDCSAQRRFLDSGRQYM